MIVSEDIEGNKWLEKIISRLELVRDVQKEIPEVKLGPAAVTQLISDLEACVTHILFLQEVMSDIDELQ